MAPSEETLMREYVGGSREAFARLFDRLAPALHAFFLRSRASRAVADDLLQTTFLKVHRSRFGWRPEHRVRPWVFTIATRVRLDAIRRSRELAGVTGDEGVEAADAASALDREHGAEVALFRRMRVDRVRDALERLPEAQRIVIHLHRYEGMSFADIAEALGTTEGAARARAFRGYERLRALLADLLREDA